MNYYTHQQLLNLGKLTYEDLNLINQRRRVHNRLGFAYQLVFVRLYNYFPTQTPSLEIDNDILAFVGVQLNMDTTIIGSYTQRQPTLSEHQELIRTYLDLQSYESTDLSSLQQFIYEEATRLEQTNLLLTKAKQFLRTCHILQPADYTLRRLIVAQRQSARDHIFKQITQSLSTTCRTRLDDLLETNGQTFTPFHTLKQAPRQASPKALLRLAENLEIIQNTGVLTVDLSWLNNNYQRSLTQYARRCSTGRVSQLTENHRYAVLVCFLHQTYQDMIDYIIDTHDKLLTGVYKRAQTDVDDQAKKQRKQIRASLKVLQTLGSIILDEAVDDQALRQTFFEQIAQETLAEHLTSIDDWLNGKYSHVFRLVMERFPYLRQFAPTLLEALTFSSVDNESTALVQGIQLLQGLNEESKRKLPDDAPLDFVPKSLRPFVENEDGSISKNGWECALLTAIRDDIRAGNLVVGQSKRFGRFDDFFISNNAWQVTRSDFFKRNGLPEKAGQVPQFLTKKLNQAYDDFLASLPQNTYASIADEGWQLSVDAGVKLDADEQQRLDQLHRWLDENMRSINLPDLLVEVDNDLHFTPYFMSSDEQDVRVIDQVCPIVATIIAHGCNIGPFTMARITDGVEYNEIKRITDWQLTDEAQKQALAQVVRAISRLQVTQTWGEGRTSSSDGQRFSLQQKVLQRTYSHRFNDYALEFYYFIADNYAPFYSTAIECTDRDAAYVLDGLLYNESDLALEEHYTDTHGYTELNFAAFAMLGRSFAPRIRGLKHQRIYRIDKEKDYGQLTPLVNRWDRTIHLDWICEQWDRIAHFYASLASGHATASTALKRLVGFNGKNHFYRANRELGRIFKTEYILRYMSDPSTRLRVRRGLLKSEELNALARQVAYGKLGQLTTRALAEQQNTSSCLTLIMAAIIYWQAKEISRVIQECNPQAAGVDLSLLEHISPIGWDNVILYGEYVLKPDLVK